MDFKEKANEVQEKLKEQLGNIDTEKLKEQAKGVADKAVDFAKEQVEKIDTDKLKEQAIKAGVPESVASKAYAGTYTKWLKRSSAPRQRPPQRITALSRRSRPSRSTRTNNFLLGRLWQVFPQSGCTCFSFSGVPEGKIVYTVNSKSRRAIHAV